MSDRRPLVSVVVPSLNQARFLSSALDSVLAQDYRPLELIVMDGGSRDGTVDLLKKYGDDVQWVSESDGSQAAAVNGGWRRARGAIFGWLNADDTYLAGAIRAAVEAFEADPDLDVAYGEASYVDADGLPLRPYLVEDFDYHRLLRRAVCFIPQPATFLRRQVVERMGELDESLHYVLDFEYWLRLGAAGRRFRRLRVPMATLRLHAEAKSVRDLAAFGPEIATIYERLARSELPAELCALLPEALASAHYRASQCLFWGGELAPARRHAIRGWRHTPWRPRFQLLAALGGSLARSTLKFWRGDPFRAGVETAG